MLSAYSLTLAFGAGFCFMLANIGTKFTSHYSPLICLPIIFALAVIGILMQIEALKSVRLGHIVVIVIATEVLLSMIFAWVFFAETYTMREGAGIALVIVGVSILALGDSAGPAQATRAIPAAAADEPRPPTKRLAKGPRVVPGLHGTGDKARDAI